MEYNSIQHAFCILNKASSDRLIKQLKYKYISQDNKEGYSLNKLLKTKSENISFTQENTFSNMSNSYFSFADMCSYNTVKFMNQYIYSEHKQDKEYFVYLFEIYHNKPISSKQTKLSTHNVAQTTNLIAYPLSSATSLKQCIDIMDKHNKSEEYPLHITSSVEVLLDLMLTDIKLNRQITIFGVQPCLYQFNTCLATIKVLKNKAFNNHNANLILDKKTKTFFNQLRLLCNNCSNDDAVVLILKILNELPSTYINESMVQEGSLSLMETMDSKIHDIVLPQVLKSHEIKQSEKDVYIHFIPKQTKDKYINEIFDNFTNRELYSLIAVSFFKEYKDKINIQTLSKSTLKTIDYEDYLYIIGVDKPKDTVVNYLARNIHVGGYISKACIDALAIYIGSCDTDEFKQKDLSSLHAVLMPHIYAKDNIGLETQTLFGDLLNGKYESIDHFCKGFIEFLLKNDRQCMTKINFMLKSNTDNTFYAFVKKTLQKIDNPKIKQAVMKTII